MKRKIYLSIAVGDDSTTAVSTSSRNDKMKHCDCNIARYNVGICRARNNIGKTIVRLSSPLPNANLRRDCNREIQRTCRCKEPLSFFFIYDKTINNN